MKHPSFHHQQLDEFFEDDDTEIAREDLIYPEVRDE